MYLRVVCNAAKVFAFMLYIDTVSTQLPADQVSAMTNIYNILQNNTAVWNSVLKTSNPCSWKGVGCNSNNSFINTISLKSSSITTSEFLPFVCHIPTLESLDVSNNQLSSIPYSFFTACGEISGLKELDFSGNRLLGSLPTFYGFPMLERLDFSANGFFGEVGFKLERLDSLKNLDLGWNRFRGKIPTNLGRMNRLETFVMSANLFSGELPVEITKYKNLRYIDFSQNQLSGSIPVGFGEFTKLETMILSFNSLSGGIPSSLSNITTLRRFSSNRNTLNGSIPSGMTSLLSTLDLSYNGLTGGIPSDLLSGANLEFLDLSFNNLEGPIPAIGSTKLYRLRLSSNSLNGTFPSASLGSRLGYLEADNNSLSGEIPLELGVFKNLIHLNLANNGLGGTLPPSLGDLTSLEVLNLESNGFVGGIPPQIILQLNRLLRLNIGRNSLNGSIPASVGNLASLIELQLGSNQLNGEIPVMPERLQIALNLSHNLFHGHIPNSLSRLQNLQVLDLSNNRLSGAIPSLLTDLSSLTQLLLANNDLSGVVPAFGYRVTVDTVGNKDLIRVRGNSAPGTPPGERKKSSVVNSEVAIAAACGVPVGLLIAVIARFISRMYRSINGTLPAPNSIHTPNIDFKKAMEAVSDHSNITFKTAFSTFYKAVMPWGTAYLVKKIKHTDKIVRFPQHKQLVEELELFGTLSNPNVMIPVAYVLTLRRAYLFYDFVRGTLYDILHHRMGNKLDWPSRYNIAVGVSKGLAYLHECPSGTIILMDLCSKTILLKTLDEPQISDVELCNLIPRSNNGCKSGRATAEGNVYSLGVVLLELVTGKAAVGEEDELVTWAVSVTEWDQILDSNVCETSNGVREMAAVVEVAFACVSVLPEMRPNAVTVVQMLLNARQSDALAED